MGKTIAQPSIGGETNHFFENFLTKPKRIHEIIKPSVGKLMLQKIWHKQEALFKKMPKKGILPIRKKNKKIMNFFGMILIVKKFVKKIKEMTFQGRFKKLTPNHFELINDKSRLKEKHLIKFDNNFTTEYVLLKKVIKLLLNNIIF